MLWSERLAVLITLAKCQLYKLIDLSVLDWAGYTVVHGAFLLLALKSTFYCKPHSHSALFYTFKCYHMQMHQGQFRVHNIAPGHWFAAHLSPTNLLTGGRQVVLHLLSHRHPALSSIINIRESDELHFYSIKLMLRCAWDSFSSHFFRLERVN